VGSHPAPDYVPFGRFTTGRASGTSNPVRSHQEGAGPPDPDAGRPPYFFLSPAPGEDEAFVGRFFKDFSAAVRDRLGLTGTPDVGYLDTAVLDVAHWPLPARRAVAVCRTLVPLHSDGYFRSRRCDWIREAFTARVRRYQAATGQRATTLVPVVWDAVRLPAHPPEDDDIDAQPHPTPAAADVRTLLGFGAQRVAYQRFLRSLARRVVEAAGRFDLPAAGWADVPAAAVPATPRPAGSLTSVLLVPVAGTAEEMRLIRTDVANYGRRPDRWSPYRGLQGSLAEHARRQVVAHQAGWACRVVPPAQLRDLLRDKRRPSDVIVLLIDAWAVRSEELRAVLDAANVSDHELLAVLVSADRDDLETVTHRDVLRAELRAALPNRWHQRDLFRPDLDTLSHFDDALASALPVASLRMMRSIPRAGVPAVRPVLGGPR